MEKIIVYGAGRHAELTAELMKKYKLHQVVAFIVKKKFLDKSELNGYPVFPYENIENTHPPDKFKMFVAVGPQYINRAREELFQDAKKKGYSFVNCICPSPYIDEDVQVGENVFIDQFCWISSFVNIGDNSTLIASKIGHHSKIGDNCFISGSMLAGNVNLEKNVFIGLGSVIGPNIILGKYTLVGLGCTISKNTDPASVYLNQSTKKKDFDAFKLKIF